MLAFRTVAEMPVRACAADSTIRDVSDLLLAVPDLLTASFPESGVASGEPVATRLRFGAAQPVAGGWRGGIAHALGLAGLRFKPVAALVAAAAGAPVDAHCLLATPLHWQAGTDRLYVPQDPIQRLDAAESAGLAASFGAVFGADSSLRLLPVPDGGFLLWGLECEDVVCAEPWELPGQDLHAAMPTGPGAAPLRRLMSEIEMWLHEHPLNQDRERRGQRSVSTLWLWGAGELRSAAITGAAAGGPAASEAAGMGRNEPLRVIAEDPGVLALARLAGAIRADAITGEAPTVLVTSARAFAARWAAEASAALVDGRIERLTVMSRDRAVQVTRGDRWRLWRPQRSAHQALS